MSLPARAIYLNVLFQIYEYGGSVPSDRKQLLKLTMATPEEFESVWPEIERHIVPLDSDPTRLTNVTAMHYLDKLTREHQVAVESGRLGGRPQKGRVKGKPKGNDNHVDVDIEREKDKTQTVSPFFGSEREFDGGPFYAAFLTC